MSTLMTLIPSFQFGAAYPSSSSSSSSSSFDIDRRRRRTTTTITTAAAAAAAYFFYKLTPLSSSSSFSPSKLHAITSTTITTIDHHHQITTTGNDNDNDNDNDNNNNNNNNNHNDYDYDYYNHKIRQLCELGNLKKSVELVEEAAPSIHLDLTTYCSVLQLCADHKSLQYGTQIHSIICANGVAIQGLLAAKLVFMYVKCGQLKQARFLLFDHHFLYDPFLWNLLIKEYSNIGHHKESLSIFKHMILVGIQLDSFTFTHLCKTLAALASSPSPSPSPIPILQQGRMVHASLLKLGFSTHNTVVNSLISFYFNCGCIQTARHLFDHLLDRDVISWNSMLTGYIYNALPHQALRMFHQMIHSGLKLDKATFTNVLKAYAQCGKTNLSFARAAHALAIKSRCHTQINFNNTLIHMYSMCGDFDSSLSAFQNMGQKDVVSWTSMLAAYARQGLSHSSVRLFHEMLKAGVKPDNIVITSILHACACTESLDDGRKIHDYIRKHNMQSNVSVCNAVMDMYAKCGSMNDAERVFSQMPVKDIISWNTMIGGYSKNSLPNEALDIFSAMLKKSKPDGRTMTCILPACASLSALQKGREIHGHVLRNGFLSDRYVANALVDMYVKCGALVPARSLFDMMPTKDLVSWTVIIAGYGMHGFGSKAVATFNEMRHAGVEPEEISFISILSACSHSGLLDEGLKFFNMMQNDFKIKPKEEHYACMVDLLARTGNISKAYTFIKSMKVAPNAKIWGALLSGCRVHHDVKMAEKVAEHVFELEPENTWYYVLLANIYAEAEKWEEVKKVKDRIGGRVLRKNPECSWIEISGKVNIFFGGDKSNVWIKKIESLLNRLRLRMKAEGYFGKVNYALINEEEKEIGLCGHSEKLAMGFGILRLAPRETIRVTKNLRVCGECHEMAKFISKTGKREIILRDSNRFHHFKDGVCSCRGLW